MRVLIVSQYFWPENFRVNDLAREVIARGHDVTVLTGQPNYPDGAIFPDFRKNPSAFATFEGAQIFRVPLTPRGSGSFQLVLNYLSFVLTAATLGLWKLRGRRFDAIFVFQTSPITAALPAVILRRLKRAPLLMWVLDLWPDTLAAIGVVKSRRLLAVVGVLVRFIYRRCDRILVQSEAFYDNVRTYAGSTDRIRYFPGWAEPVFADGTDRAEPAPELAPHTGHFNVLFAGNIGHAQDFPAILDAAEALREERHLRWVVVGDGRAAPMLRQEIARRGLGEQVVMLGRYPLARMPSFFGGADALLVSLRDEPIWSMTIPGKIQSYLAAGKPLLGMLNGEGARVIVQSGAGLASPAGQGRALAENVRAMMAMSTEQRAAMGQSGQHYCRREFDRATLLDAFEAWIGELEGRLYDAD